MHFKDIDYGVLDVTVTFHSEGQLVHLYLLHYFALTERHDKNSCLYDGWQDMFDFPPALQKLVVTHQGRTIQLFQQQCIAINDNGISVYGPNKALRRRLVLGLRCRFVVHSSQFVLAVPGLCLSRCDCDIQSVDHFLHVLYFIHVYSASFGYKPSLFPETCLHL